MKAIELKNIVKNYEQRLAYGSETHLYGDTQDYFNRMTKQDWNDVDDNFQVDDLTCDIIIGDYKDMEQNEELFEEFKEAFQEDEDAEMPNFIGENASDYTDALEIWINDNKQM